MTLQTSRIALVTGAGSGIGRAVSIALAADGWTLVLAGRRADKLEETRSLIGPGSPPALAVPADVADEASVKGLFDAVTRAHGRLDLLFNNAGMGMPAVELDEITTEQWRRVVDVNLTGVFLCTREAFRMMKSQRPMGGRIINNGSISAQVPRVRSIAYTATKHAVTGITRSTSLDGRPYNIACGQIDIGNAETELAARMKEGVPQAHGAIAAEPTMDVDNVARAVVYMASLPLNANVQFMTVMATNMPFIGRG
jgi:NAD(P)-dependent dehydrogenase (short-subunit alcohol dehydrogenase family)